MLAFALVPLFALGAAAIQVIAPSNATGWTSSGAQTIQWTSVSTDPGNFTIQLINPANPNAPTTLAQNVNTADARYTYTPSSALAPGRQWRVNLISSSNTGSILAQSEYFEVTQGNAVSSTTTGVAPSVISVSSSASSTASSVTDSVASATTSPNGSVPPSTSSRAAADRTLAVSGMGVLAAAVLSYLA